MDELREPPNLRKTTLCRFYARGKCNLPHFDDALQIQTPHLMMILSGTLGDDCKYAHGSKELRATEGIYKSAICNWWKQGHCQYGSRCRYVTFMSTIIG